MRRATTSPDRSDDRRRIIRELSESLATMSRYRFSLQPIRRLRQAHRDAQRERLGEAIHAASILESHENTVLRELEQLRQTRRNSMQGASIDVNRLLDTQRYELLMQGQLQAVRQQQQTIALEIDRRREAMAEAEQQVRVLDKLDERKQEEWHRAELRREELVLNELATQMHRRQREDGY